MCLFILFEGWGGERGGGGGTTPFGVRLMRSHVFPSGNKNIAHEGCPGMESNKQQATDCCSLDSIQYGIKCS